VLENLDFEGRKKRCEFRLIGLNTKKNDIIKSINRMQKFLIEKRNKLQEVDKEICKTEEEIFTLEAQEFALNLKNNKVDIKKLNANKVAQTIIEQKDILLKEENEVSPDRENTELLLDDKSIDNMTINVDKSEEDL
jgi:septal ring factor EnvC (AmiA/AmiB activator)